MTKRRTGSNTNASEVVDHVALAPNPTLDELLDEAVTPAAGGETAWERKQRR